MSIGDCGKPPTEIDWAWASGFYEGEGTCVFIPTHFDRKVPSGRVEFKVSQVDKEPLLRFAWAVGEGNILGPYPNGQGNQPIYQWTVNKPATIKAVMSKMWPWLSDRRKAQYADALEKMQVVYDLRAERNKSCRKGLHPKDGPGKCLECRKVARSAWLQNREYKGIMENTDE